MPNTMHGETFPIVYPAVVFHLKLKKNSLMLSVLSIFGSAISTNGKLVVWVGGLRF